MRARQPRKHMPHMGSSKMITINPNLARKIVQARGGLSPAAIKILKDSQAKAKAAKTRNYWLIGGGVALVTAVGGVLIYKARSKSKG